MYNSSLLFEIAQKYDLNVMRVAILNLKNPLLKLIALKIPKGSLHIVIQFISFVHGYAGDFLPVKQSKGKYLEIVKKKRE